MLFVSKRIGRILTLAAAGVGALLLALVLAAWPARAQTENTATGSGALSNPANGSYNTADGFDALNANTYGSYNTAVGASALLLNTSGAYNTAVGGNALLHNTTGGYNTAVGVSALDSNTDGEGNMALGYHALSSNTAGSNNTAEGAQALNANTEGNDNTAMGYQALYSNVTGSGNVAIGDQALADFIGTGSASVNTAVGFQALYHTTSGSANTAVGYQALVSNTTGGENAALGESALLHNTSGGYNVAVGYESLRVNTTGEQNTALGTEALLANTTGGYNTGTGDGALNANTTGSDNTANGFRALAQNTTGSNNVGFGYAAGSNIVSGSNNIEIGNVGAADSNTIRIGTEGTQTAAYIAGITGVTVASGVTVIVDGNGHLGTVVSSQRYKQDIQPMNTASEALLALKPVTFLYKHELDPDRIPQFGLVAEDVAKVDPDLVARNAKGEVYTVRYEAVNAMLLNEFLKEHQQVQAQASDDCPDRSGRHPAPARVGRPSGHYQRTSGAAPAGELAGGTGESKAGQGGRQPVGSNHEKTTVMRKTSKLIGSLLPPAAAATLALILAVSTGQAQVDNTMTGSGALANLTDGSYNTADGFDALNSNMYGGYNTAVGANALSAAKGGTYNTAVGGEAGFGVSALSSETPDSGNTNTTLGYEAFSGGSGSHNTVIGYQAMADTLGNYPNNPNGGSSGNENTVLGDSVLFSDTTGSENVAIGYRLGNTTGNQNTILGAYTGSSNSTGSSNTATGASALSFNTTGVENTMDGAEAFGLCKTGSNNIGLGSEAGSLIGGGSSNCLQIGMQSAGGYDTTRIGQEGTQTATYIAGISGATVASGVPVIIDSDGQLGTVVSSQRYKQDIQPMDRASEAILALKPVTFRYKQELDPDGIPQFGLVAEDVARVDPDLVARNAKGEVYTVRYEAVNAMLLNEFLKEHQQVQAQQATIARIEAAQAERQQDLDALAAVLKARAGLLQKLYAHDESE